MKTSNTNNQVPYGGTIPTASQYKMLLDFSEKSKQERADARTIAKIQKAFQRAIRFNRWSDKITLWGVTYRMLYANGWIEDFLRSKGYDVILFEENKMTDAQFSRALSKPVRLRLR